jgi:hypothetical protein
MSMILRSIVTVALSFGPTAMVWAQDANPGNSGGGHAPIAVPTYDSNLSTDPALTTGSRFSVKTDTPSYENPTAPGATGMTVVKGDKSTISLDRRGTIQQKTGGSASDAPG